MNLWAIIPVKALRQAKSRLAGVLSPEERATLGERLLARTLAVLAQVPTIGHILVISADRRAMALARHHGARAVREAGTPDLNRALRRATMLASRAGASAVLVLPADLPRLTPEEVAGLVEQGNRPPVVVIAPDRQGQGTNALLLSPVGLIEYAFGPNSFKLHIERAQLAGARVVVCSSPGLGLDLDGPGDLGLLEAGEISVEGPGGG